MRDFIEEHQDTINFIIAGLLLLAVVFVFSLIKIYVQQDKGEVVAEVNGEKIYDSELKARMKNMPSNLQREYSEEVVLDQMIQELLLLQRIEELGLGATDEELQQEIEDFKQQRGLTDDSLDQILNAAQMSRDELKQTLKRQLLVDKLLKRELEGLNVSDEDARAYYNDNAASFVMPPASTIKQALIPINNKSNATAEAQVEMLLNSALEEGFSNLCELSTEYANQSESGCGTYNITRNSGLPPSFVNASLEMEVGESMVVETRFGYHVLYKLSEREERVQRFESVKGEIKAQLRNARKKNAYRQYISRLRENATIKNYLLDEIIKNVTAPKETVSWENKTSCIANNSILYGARWDSQTREQLKLLGNATEKIRYVECSQPHSLDQRQACERAGIQAYPTWVIGGEEELGVQSVERLASLTSCN